ncbi:hypothetical protein SDC9_194219 [bioreactor metagenome]|uniref:Uncharacterized protein n=1 Tax=bioreactor metagenome TaxID=1076179 RepID=A0A645I5U6_9ZZZZ
MIPANGVVQLLQRMDHTGIAAVVEVRVQLAVEHRAGVVVVNLLIAAAHAPNLDAPGSAAVGVARKQMLAPAAITKVVARIRIVFHRSFLPFCCAIV